MRAQSKISVFLAVMCLALGLSMPNTRAFSLLGPVQPWMQSSNGVIYPGDIGGPMSISNGYRWNVPVVTYGFDQSFLDFFGTNGVAAVESAIQVLNDLPPASQISLTNYPFNSVQVNFAAQAKNLLDLKSETLPFLLEHLGLAQPTRYIYVLHDLDSSYFTNLSLNYAVNIAGMPIFYDSSGPGGYPGSVTNLVAGFNFDPATFGPSIYINNVGYAGEILTSGSGHYFVEPFLINPLANPNNVVADFSLSPGEFYTGLTFDDVGGLRYLFSTNNLNYETLLPSVGGVGTNASLIVNGAWRPGVDKITFIRQPVGSQSGTFQPTTNYFTDNYITNGILKQQQLARVILQPDFLFSAENDALRTGTTNWINNSSPSNNSTGAGPGIIRPPVVIAFQKTGNYFYSSPSSTYPVIWSEDSVQDVTSESGTFDGSTNAPIVYPASQTGNVTMAIRVLLSHANSPFFNFQSFEWTPTSLAGTVYALQTSTNLSNWNTLFVVTNNGSVCTYQNVNANSLSRFYRLVPQ